MPELLPFQIHLSSTNPNHPFEIVLEKHRILFLLSPGVCNPSFPTERLVCVLDKLTGTELTLIVSRQYHRDEKQ